MVELIVEIALFATKSKNQCGIFGIPCFLGVGYHDIQHVLWQMNPPSKISGERSLWITEVSKYHEASGRSAMREAFQNNVSMVTTIIMKTKDEARFGISPTQIS
jgi:hypothetical protein